MRFRAPTGVVGVVRVIGVVLLALSAALVTGACGSDTAPADARAGDPTLAAIRSDIFNGTCALGSCHAEPTLAAKLDLHNNGLCHLLVSHKSCLFSDRQLVVPGKPEASFLLNKLRGTGLEGTPDPACATSNERMPLGQPPLSGAKLAQIEAWIQAGASCGDDVATDAGVADGAIDGPDESLADVASVSAVATTIHVAEPTQMTVTLTHGAPPAGQTIILEVDDGNILGVPNAVHVDQGISSVTFDVLGKAVGPATITVSSGTNSMTITITVISLTLSDDKASTTQLAEALPSGSPVMDSPTRKGSNGNPAYRNGVDFSLTLLNGSVVSMSFPPDVAFRGQHHLAGLRGAVGLAATFRCSDMAAGGHDVAKTSVTTWGYQATPTSSNCTL
jgi:hypothetical protein